MEAFIPKEATIPRGVYLLNSRNIFVGVYDGDGGFIGIRRKFHDEFLFAEYHWDNGPPYGTVKPYKFLMMLPEDIEVRESSPRTCNNCGALVDWTAEGGWYHTEPAEDCTELDPVGHIYKPLFDFLKPLDELACAASNNEYEVSGLKYCMREMLKVLEQVDFSSQDIDYDSLPWEYWEDKCAKPKKTGGDNNAPR